MKTIKTMKNWILPLLVLVSLLGAQPTLAQVRSPHTIGAKVLFLEHGRANGVDSLDITNGIEGVYKYNFNPFFGFALPGKVALANVVDEPNTNRSILSLDGLLHFNLVADSSKLVPYLLGGGGVVWEEVLGVNIQIPLGLGFNLKVGKNSAINFQGEYRISTEDNRNNIQAGLGFLYNLGKQEADRDRDGVPDNKDKCPDEFGDKMAGGCPDRDGDGMADNIDLCPDVPGLKELGGCPDQDGDGVTDGDDECPEVAGVVELNGCPDQDEDGIADKDDKCPEVAGVKAFDGCPDSDEDGIQDSEDECPNEFGTKANNGCPGKDADGDGIPDDEDECPTEAGTKATRGCPDRDGDGVADKDDRCPDKAGPFAGCPDTDGDGTIDADDKCPDEVGPTTNKGCPEIEEEVKEVLEFAMRAVRFETGRATLKAESFEVLDQIVDIMNQYEAYSLRISGHTDNVGDEFDNQVLSEERAKACYAYLVSKGISPLRLSFIGYGETQPLASNQTSQGRRLNRRTEFELYLK